MRLSALVCALALAAPHAQAAGAKWIGSWGASPAMPMAAPTNNPARSTASFDNQTVTQIVRLSAGGSRLRLRLSNEYGPKPLQVGVVRVALVSADGAVIAGSERAVSFSGAASATLPAGAPILSDPVALPTRPLARLRVSLYLPADTNGCTCHTTGQELIAIAPGDATQAPPPAARGAGDYRAFLTEVDVETAAPVRPVIATFGDSITDGYRSTDGANHRWPDRLAERLLAAKTPFAVINTAISGNRVLSEQLPIFGQNALSRFDRDVLSVPGVTHVTVLEGVNDLGMTKPTPTAAQLIRLPPAHRPRPRARPEDHRRDGPALWRRRLFHSCRRGGAAEDQRLDPHRPRIRRGHRFRRRHPRSGPPRKDAPRPAVR
jgi:hypothetical protein